MSSLNWESARKKSINKLRGTTPANEYEPIEEDFVCVIRDEELNPESHKKVVRLRDLLQHIKSVQYRKKTSYKQIEIVKEVHSLHKKLILNDTAYLGSTTYRHTRLALQSYLHWLEKTSAGYVFF